MMGSLPEMQPIQYTLFEMLLGGTRRACACEEVLYSLDQSGRLSNDLTLDLSLAG